MPKTVTYNGTAYTFPDDATDAEIAESLETMDQGMGKPAQTPPTRTWGETAADFLPDVGGIIGGVAGGKKTPLGVAGAAVGGAAGEGYRQIARHATEIPGAVRDVASNLMNPDARAATIAGAQEGMGQGALTAGKQAAIQGGSELAGRGLVAGATKFGHGLMSVAVNAPKALRKEFPDLVETIMKNRVPVGSAYPGQVPGSIRMDQLRQGASQATDYILDKAGQAGIRIQPRDLLSSATRLTRRLANRPIAGPTVNTLRNLMKQYMGEHSVPNMVTRQAHVPSVMGDVMAGQPASRTVTQTVQRGTIPVPMTPAQVKAMKQIAQAESAPIIRGEAKGQVVPTGEKLGARFERAVGKDAKQALEGMGQGFGELVEKAEARTKSLIGAGRGLAESELRQWNLNPFEARQIGLGGLALFGGIGTAAGATGGDYTEKARRALISVLATRAAMDPRILSRAALGLTKHGFQTVLGQLPRAAAALFPDEPDEGP